MTSAAKSTYNVFQVDILKPLLNLMINLKTPINYVIVSILAIVFLGIALAGVRAKRSSICVLTMLLCYSFSKEAVNYIGNSFLMEYELTKSILEFASGGTLKNFIVIFIFSMLFSLLVTALYKGIYMIFSFLLMMTVFKEKLHVKLLAVLSIYSPILSYIVLVIILISIGAGCYYIPDILLVLVLSTVGFSCTLYCLSLLSSYDIDRISDKEAIIILISLGVCLAIHLNVLFGMRRYR